MEWERLLSTLTQAEREEEPQDFEKYPISAVEKDYKSIVSSASFRRLQDKTQVFPLDKSDFVRTRLTHSLEVSTVARQIGIMITQNTTQYLQAEFKENKRIVDTIPSVLSCAGLLHDLGNPPFGHFGEVVIGEWFRNEFEKESFTYKGLPVKEVLSEQMKRDLENFEGNAQALRILSKIKNKDGSHEINLTASVMSALIKYPTDSLEFDSDAEDIRKHKLGYFYAERSNFEDICKVTGTLRADKSVARHPLAYLMEAADDIAYAAADLEDAYIKQLFTLEQFIEYMKIETEKIHDNEHKKYTEKLITNLEERISHIEGPENKDNEEYMVAFQNWMEYVKGWLMYVVAYSFSLNYDKIMEGKYRHDMFHNTNHESSIVILKGAMREFVYDSPEILKLELSAKKIISALMDDFIYAVIYWEDEDEEYKQTKGSKKLISLLPSNLKNDYLGVKTKDGREKLYLRFLMVTDYISSMTDSYAKDLYQQLNGI